MIRLIFLLGSLGGVFFALDGIWVDITSHGKVAVKSIDDIVAHPGDVPRYVEIQDAIGNVYVCRFNKFEESKDPNTQQCSEMMIPLLSRDQVANLEDGKPVTAAVILKADEDLKKKCNASKNDCLNGAVFRGVTQHAIVNDLEDKDKAILQQNNISADKNTILLEMEDAPEPYVVNIFALLFSLAIGFAVIKFWPKKKVAEEV